MVQAVLERGKRPILFNVPHVNERMFPPRMAREVHGKRDYHNPRLKSLKLRISSGSSRIPKNSGGRGLGAALRNAPNSGEFGYAQLRKLKSFCDEHGIPLADICGLLRDEHFGDELHPNGRGAKIIVEAVFQVLPKE